MHRWVVLTTGALACVLILGCGTTRMSDSPRTATEQMLISNAVDEAVSQVDFRVLSGQEVYFDHSFIDAKLDKGYLISTLRQQILAHGCLLQEKREDAEYVIEARAGGLGTDRHALLIGVPEMSLPTIVPGQPSRIPEIPFAKKTDQHGVAKVAVFAFNRRTGERVWQSGVVQSQSTAKDLWLLGAGPFQHGSIRSHTTFAGELIPVPFIGADGELQRLPASVVKTSQPNAWIQHGKRPRNAVTSPDYDELMANVLPLGGAGAAGALLSSKNRKARANDRVSERNGPPDSPNHGE